MPPSGVLPLSSTIKDNVATPPWRAFSSSSANSAPLFITSPLVDSKAPVKCTAIPMETSVPAPILLCGASGAMTFWILSQAENPAASTMRASKNASLVMGLIVKMESPINIISGRDIPVPILFPVGGTSLSRYEPHRDREGSPTRRNILVETGSVLLPGVSLPPK